MIRFLHQMETRLDHRGSWVQIPSGAPIFSSESPSDTKNVLLNVVVPLARLYNKV